MRLLRYGSNLMLTAGQRIKWERYLAARQHCERKVQQIIQSILDNLSTDELQVLVELPETGKGETEVSQTVSELLKANEEVIQAAENEADIEENRFRKSLGKRKRQIFEARVLPFLGKSAPSEHSPHFDLSLAQRWTLERVFGLGWTVERFGRFDRHIGRNDRREARKAERIGKKYQWIAYHEFLARLADNFQFRASQSGHFQERNQFMGTWQIDVFDIDPSCVLKETAGGDVWEPYSSTWWFPYQYTSWDYPADNVSWLKQADDLPSFESLIGVANPQDSSHWFALDGFYRWQQPTPPEEEKFDITRREIWYILRGYLIHRSDIDELFGWALEQDFMGQWMPETHSLSGILLGEFFWSPAYNYYNDPYERTVGWQYGEPNSRVPRPVMPLADGYLQEDSGFDCSIDKTISIKLPNQLVVETMDLRWDGIEGSYFDRTGELMAFDPSVGEEGPSVLLINRQAFLTFLQENDYSVLWTALGKKQLIGGGTAHQYLEGTMELSGAYCIRDEKVEGKMTPKFRSLSDEGTP
jgi:hypothetical protein